MSSAGGSELPAVPQTVIPSPAAAAVSTEALRIPDVTISRSRGSRFSSSASSGVRSRMTTTISQSPAADRTTGGTVLPLGAAAVG